jgi:hypothetical protein
MRLAALALVGANRRPGGPLMSFVRAGLVAISLALPAGPAAAGSQSSNSSSNCSNGRCTHVETYSTDDGRRVRSYSRRESWDEGRERRRHRRYDGYPYHGGGYHQHYPRGPYGY